MKAILSIIACTLLLFSSLSMTFSLGTNDGGSHTQPGVLRNDVLRDLEPFDPSLLPHSQSGPGYYDLSEYFFGSVSVGVIFLESNGQSDPNLENWTTAEITKVRAHINQSLTWWLSQNPNANITYITDVHLCPTSVEPIIHPSGCTDPSWQQIWIGEAMADLGYTSGDYMKRTRDYINAIRDTYATDWTYVAFVVDSSADDDGYFSDMYCAYSYLGGPFLVMTYDNGPFGIDAMDQVMAHETAHIFWATDEYNGVTEYSGYLNAPDIEGAACLMYDVSLRLCNGTRQQVGWRDTDEDGLDDIIDTTPETTLIPYTPDPPLADILTYNGSTVDVAYPNQNPWPWDPGNDITINHIASVSYHVDGGTYLPGSPKDGAFDEESEDYTFTTVALPPGQHTIEAVATNSVGNTDPTPAQDAVTIDSPPSDPAVTGTARGKKGVEYTYTVSSIDLEGDLLYYWIDWGDGTNTSWLGSVPAGQPTTAKHAWSAKGSYTVRAKAKDTVPRESGWGTLQVTMPLSYQLEDYRFFEWLFDRFPNAFPILRHLLGY